MYLDVFQWDWHLGYGDIKKVTPLGNCGTTIHLIVEVLKTSTCTGIGPSCILE